MGRLAVLWLLGVGAAPPEHAAWNRFEFERTEMAVTVRIVLYANDSETANGAAEAAFDRFRQLNDILSDYDPTSELRRLCDTSGEGVAVAVGEDLWTVLHRAQEVSEQSGGAFDVTVGPVVRLWRRARRQKELPPQEMLAEARACVGYQFIRMDPETRKVELLRSGMRLDLGGIAKGYAIDQALVVLREHGITRALVDAGGDVGLGDPPPDKPGWRIGVASLEPDSPPSRYLLLSNAAVATSGDTWQYVRIGGRRYSHLVDPHTGIGLTDHSSVTVIAADATTADAWASAVSVMGPHKGLARIDRIPGAAALVVRAPQGAVETCESRRWKELPVVCSPGD